MGLDIEKRGDHSVFTFGKEITIAEVSAFRENLIQNLGSPHRLTLNLQQIESIDLAGLQLLCATNRSLETQRRDILVETLVNKDFFKTFLIQAGYAPSGSCHEQFCTRCLWKETQQSE